MYSNLVAFESILDIVKDDTGITILKNDYPKIRRLIYRVEKDIGYGGSVILKKVNYSIENGTIIFDGKNYKARLPDNVIRLESMGMCSGGFCPGDYRIQGNWLFFCGSGRLHKFTLLYYTLLHDGEGNPVTTENHSEAVAAGISYWLYKSRVFNKKANANMLQYYENYYHDRIGEARGDDIWPETQEEWSKIARILQWSSRDVLIYSEAQGCFCEVPSELAEVYAPALAPSGGSAGHTNAGGGAPGGSGAGDGSYVDPYVVPVVEEEVNLPPTMNDLTIDISSIDPITITIEMFEQGAGAPYSDPENDALASVRIDAINPNNLGLFYFNGNPVIAGLIIAREEVMLGYFTYVPADSVEPHVDSLSISVRDSINGTWV